MVQLVVHLVELLCALLGRVLTCKRAPHPVRFCILAMPRSGSTALVHALNGHARMRCAGEILNPLYRVYGDISHARGWRRALHMRSLLSWHALAVRCRCGPWWGRRARGGHVAVGFKVLDEQLGLGTSGAQMLRVTPPPFVHIIYYFRADISTLND